MMWYRVCELATVRDARGINIYIIINFPIVAQAISKVQHCTSVKLNQGLPVRGTIKITFIIGITIIVFK